MIYLFQDEMPASIPWHVAFAHALPQHKVIKNLDINPKPKDIFIGRFNMLAAKQVKFTYGEFANKFYKTFPKAIEMEFYDDKFKQCYFFQKHEIPFPDSKVVFNEREAKEFGFPAVCKLAHGASSQNVWLTENELLPYPCLLQRLCLGDGGDIRVYVINGKSFGLRRRNRPNDFRASGSGILEYIEDIPKECLNIANSISKINNFSCMCYDFVWDNRWVVIEMSYTFDLLAASRCSYYYEHDSKKHSNVKIINWIIKDMCHLKTFL